MHVETHQSKLVTHRVVIQAEQHFTSTLMNMLQKE